MSFTHPPSKTTHPRVHTPALLIACAALLLVSLSGLSGCVTDYSPPRAYVPTLNKKGQLGVELSASQLFVGYVPLDRLTLQLGAKYSDTEYNALNDSTERHMGAELGAHFVHPLFEGLLVSVGGGLGYEDRRVKFTQMLRNPISNRRVWFNRPHSTSIIRPSVLLSLSKKIKDHADLSIFSRAHHAIFADNALIREDPTMVELGLHIKTENRGTPLGIYCQVLVRRFLEGAQLRALFDEEMDKRSDHPLIPDDMLRASGSVMPVDASCGFTLTLD